MVAYISCRHPLHLWCTTGFRQSTRLDLLWQYSVGRREEKKILALQEVSVFPKDRSNYTHTHNELRLPFKRKNLQMWHHEDMIYLAGDRECCLNDSKVEQKVIRWSVETWQRSLQSEDTGKTIKKSWKWEVNENRKFRASGINSKRKNNEKSVWDQQWMISFWN